MNKLFPNAMVLSVTILASVCAYADPIKRCHEAIEAFDESLARDAIEQLYLQYLEQGRSYESCKAQFESLAEHAEDKISQVRDRLHDNLRITGSTKDMLSVGVGILLLPSIAAGIVSARKVENRDLRVWIVLLGGCMTPVGAWLLWKGVTCSHQRCSYERLLNIQQGFEEKVSNCHIKLSKKK